VAVSVWANEQLLTERTDGKAVPLDPGSYRLRFEAQGYAPVALAVSVRQSEKNRIVSARLKPLAAAAPKPEPGSGWRSVPTLSYVLGGVAVAGFGSFAYFGLRGSDEYDDARSRCAPSCAPKDVEDGKRAFILADVGLAIGVASAAAAVVLYLLPREQEQQQGQRAIDVARVDIAALPDGGRMRWTGSF
jgi:hypothetical protein